MIKKMLPQEFANTFNMFIVKNENGKICGYKERPLPQRGNAFLGIWKSSNPFTLILDALIKYPELESWEDAGWEYTLVCPRNAVCPDNYSFEVGV